MNTAKISITCELNSELISAFVNSLHAQRAGAMREDYPWYDKQIKRAENLDPDRTELAQFLMMRAGFQSINGGVAADFSEAE